MSINSAPTTTTTNVTLSGINVSVNISGQVVVSEISGQTISTTANVSGQSVAIWNASGRNAVYLTNQVGTIATPMTSASDIMANNNLLFVAAHLMGFNRASGGWARVDVTNSGASLSGQAHKLVVAFSGDPVGNLVYDASGAVWRGWETAYSGSTKPLVAIGDAFNTSGLTLLTPSSDAAQSPSIPVLPAGAFNYGYEATTNRFVRITATTSGSGLSGVRHKLVVAFSGDTSFEYGTAVRAHLFTVVTNLSGGTEAGSGSCFAATIRNHSGNAPMLLGGTGTEAPFSGKGMIVYGGESYDLKVDNFNKVRALAYTSGQLISVAGIDK